jgi:sodium/potassium/calcium exchanger 6
VNTLEEKKDDDDEPDTDCSIQNINEVRVKNITTECDFTQKNCEHQSLFNFLYLYYCSFHQTFGAVGRIFVFIPCGILFMFIGMYTLSSTADIYLSPALETMTTKFGLSDSLAGVTLLAFGNGAPDVFSSISAGGDSNSDGKLDAVKPISIVVGGTFFITSVVVFLSVRASNMNEDPNGAPIRKIKVTPRYFIRDVVFYMITCIYLLIVLLAF